MTLNKGKIIEQRYQIVDEIGNGGMAEVYLANDLINHQQVAIKILKEKVMNKEINLTRFNNEAVIAASLSHPNIVKVLYYGEINGLPYIVNEYIQGATLKEILDIRGLLNINEALSYMMQLMDALSYAHSHGIIHRDIKPDNIFVLSDGSVKLTDFGIAIANGYYTENLGKEIVGSVPYLAPEIVKGRIAKNYSDIYSAGITFFEMITGHLPFLYQDSIKTAMAHVKEKFPSPKKYLPSCPDDIETIIFRATKKNPEQRYRNCGTFYDDLKLVYQGQEISKKESWFKRILRKNKK